MSATTILGARRWRHDLAGRDRDFRLFRIPESIVEDCDVTWNTKRAVDITLSTGRRMRGFCTITSGTELSIPTHLQNGLREAEWFECEILGDETSDRATLDWAVP
jgi:hypothetical protein